jgi:hypothetical protein
MTLPSLGQTRTGYVKSGPARRRDERVLQLRLTRAGSGQSFSALIGKIDPWISCEKTFQRSSRATFKWAEQDGSKIESFSCRVAGRLVFERLPSRQSRRHQSRTGQRDRSAVGDTPSTQVLVRSRNRPSPATAVLDLAHYRRPPPLKAKCGASTSKGWQEAAGNSFEKGNSKTGAG